MKAFRVEAEWAPKKECIVTANEEKIKRASCGSDVWKNPVFTMQDVSVPAIGDDDLLVRVKRCGICGSDTHLYETDNDGYIIFSGPVKLPCTIGHEYSGIVEETGRNVRNFAVGDLVAAESIVWCGRCEACRSGAVNQCYNVELAGITVDGALADFVQVSALQCWKINDLAEAYSEEKAFDLGALIEPLGCAYNGIFVSAGGFMPGSTVVVHGVGPIGLGAVALTRLAGAEKIIAFDINDARLELAKQLGADFVYNVHALKKQTVRPRDIVLELSKGKGAAVQIEAAGAASATIPEMETTLGVNGTIIYLGRAATHTPIMLNNLVSGANAIVGSRGHSGYGIYANLIRLLKSGRLDAAKIITSSFAFPETFAALQQSVTRNDGKIMVNV
ncbi:MAG: alcohol dehydrogenase [Desulfobulbus propionicus]|nr:MAG: alcohol dehydrogenase [Desulfobulbus propionicus]